MPTAPADDHSADDHPSTTDNPVVYIVMRGDWEGEEILRIFTTQEAADTYAAGHPTATHVRSYPVSTQVPDRIQYTLATANLNIYIEPHLFPGYREWMRTLTPESLTVITETHDADALPPDRPNASVTVDRNDDAGQLRVLGTDETAVRRAFVDHARQMQPRIDEMAARAAADQPTQRPDKRQRAKKID